MKTVAKKVETFEAALVPVGELETVSMSDFLEAYPAVAKPIPEGRLREILTICVSKKDLPKLWLIYRGYRYLEQTAHVPCYQKEQGAVIWTIEAIILRELQNVENQNPEDARLLYDSSPHRSETRDKAEIFLKAELEKLFNKKASSIELKGRRKYFPKEFEELARKFQALIRGVAAEEMKALREPELIFACIDKDDVDISETDIVTVLTGVIEKAVDPAVVEEALKRVPVGDHPGPSVNGSVIKGGWRKIIELTNDKEVLFRVRGEQNKALKKIFTEHSPLSLEDLKRMEEHADHWVKFQHHDEEQELLRLIKKDYMTLLISADLPTTEKIMQSFKSAEKYTWKYQVRLQCVRRLYELQKPSQSS